MIDQDCQGCYPYSRRKEKHLYDEEINQKTIRNEIGPKESVWIFIHQKYACCKNEETSESETSEPEDSEKSNWSERPVR